MIIISEIWNCNGVLLIVILIFKFINILMGLIHKIIPLFNKKQINEILY